MSEAARCAGAGSAPLAEAGRHLDAGACRVLTWVSDDAASRSFAARRGYRPVRTLRILRPDLRAGRPPEIASPPSDAEIVSAADLAADPRPLHELDADCAGDEPADDGPVEPVGHGSWLELYRRHPCLDRDLSSVVVADGVRVSFGLAYTDGGDRCLSGMAGTRREFRGRGPAELAKGHPLRCAERSGYCQAFCSTDTSDTPMLAINEWFGCLVRAAEHRCVRELRRGMSAWNSSVGPSGPASGRG